MSKRTMLGYAAGVLVGLVLAGFGVGHERDIRVAAVILGALAAVAIVWGLWRTTKDSRSVR